MSSGLSRNNHPPDATIRGDLTIVIGAIISALGAIGIMWFSNGQLDRRIAAHGRAAQVREMQGFMDAVQAAAMQQKVESGRLTFEEIDRVVTEWFEHYEDETDGARQLKMWSAKTDVWGRDLRFERQQARPHRVVIRSAGLDGVYADGSDDIRTTIYVTVE
jgi:hypothetical protein